MEFLSFITKNQILTTIFFFGSIICAVLWAMFIKPQRKRIVTPLRIVFVGTFVAAMFHYTPIFLALLTPADSPSHLWDALLTAVQYAIKMFTLSGDVLWLIEKGLDVFDPNMHNFILCISSIMYIVAPMFTFGVILSFFNNLTARIQYRLSFFAHTHVLPEVNPKSIALAKDIKKNGKKFLGFIPLDVVVFTGATDKNEGVTEELISEAYETRAILLSKELDSLKLKYKFSERKISIYVISDDESKKVALSEKLMREYDLANVSLYLVSNSIHTELMMSSKQVKNMKVVRINDARAYIYHKLYDNGKLLFDRARKIGNEKVISAVIVGLGAYGLEMFKALIWFCQIEGYTLKINVFDADENAENKLKLQCPELMSEKYNKIKTFGEPYYEINVHGDTDVKSAKFADKIKEISDATYFFVSLGEDSLNLETATSIRRISEGMNYLGDGRKPDIEAAIYNHETHEIMGIKWDTVSTNKNPVGAKNHSGQPYNIIMSADIDELYSLSSLINPISIQDGWNSHLNYCLTANNKEKDPTKQKPESVVVLEAEDSFWSYEYNFRSSVAKALHIKLKKDLGIYNPIDKKEKDAITDKEKAVHLANPEHIRWSAYMRSEGYSFSGSLEKSSRNDLAKLHNNLLPTDKLDIETLKHDF